MLDLISAAAALHGRVLGGNATFTGVGTDSRQMQPGELLVAIRGERFDGHQFVEEALTARGAAAALVDEEGASGIAARPLLIVKDTRRGLGDLAAHWRGQWPGTLVGVTGSNGKTSVKEMIAAILRAHAGEDAVLATLGNLNNDIGMPLMLLRLRPQHRFAVIEMGMNHLGEIDYLTRIARPQVALINNAGTAHIGEVGSRQGIAQAKGEIFAGLREGGVAVINADDDFAGYWTGLVANRASVRFGLEKPADVTGQVGSFSPAVRMRLCIGDARTDVEIASPGRHNALNALAAAAVAHALGVGVDAIAAGLRAYRSVKGRLQIKPAAGGATLIDDTYNANPDSVKAAIDVLARGTGRRVLVLGDLGELGEYSEQLHREVGDAARAAGIDQLVTLGEASAAASAAYGAGALHFHDVDALVAHLRTESRAGVTLLVKGSRFMRMERVVEALGEDVAHTGGQQRC